MLNASISWRKAALVVSSGDCVVSKQGFELSSKAPYKSNTGWSSITAGAVPLLGVTLIRCCTRRWLRVWLWVMSRSAFKLCLGRSSGDYSLVSASWLLTLMCCCRTQCARRTQGVRPEEKKRHMPLMFSKS